MHALSDMRIALILVFATAASAAVDFSELLDYSVGKYGSKLQVTADTHEQQIRKSIIIRSPESREDFVLLSTNYHSPLPPHTQIVDDRVMLHVFMVHKDRPYKQFVETVSFDDIQTFVDAIMLGPLGIPKGQGPEWLQNIKESDIPPLLRLN